MTKPILPNFELFINKIIINTIVIDYYQVFINFYKKLTKTDNENLLVYSNL